MLIGDVEMAVGNNLWPTAVARGDLELIRIGAYSNVQDGAVLHGDGGLWSLEEVTVGHRAVIHGATLRMDVWWASVRWCSTVSPSSRCPGGGRFRCHQRCAGPHHGGGHPGQAKRELTDGAVAEQRAHARRYAELAGRHALFHG